MSQGLIERANLDFLLFDWLKLGDLLGQAPFAENSPETVAAMLDLAERLAETEFLPHYKTADNREPKLDDDGVTVLPEVGAAIRHFAEAGFFAAPFPAELGGMEVPEVVHCAAFSYFMAANTSTSGYLVITLANARLLVAHGSEKQISAFALPQIAGDALGTMCMSEPQAGSSLAHIKTRADYEGDHSLGARYRLFGNKMWTSAGDHDITKNIFHLVLAKTPGPDGTIREGTSDISLFVVPKWLIDENGEATERNDIVVAGINHKMGYRGISNCLMNLGEGTRHRPDGKAGAVGYLVGKPGSGLATMFHMMNEARVAVGLSAAAIAVRSHRLSVRYATERMQGRRGNSACAIIEHPDVKRMLMRQKVYAEGALSLVLFCAQLIDTMSVSSDAAERNAMAELLGLLTPVAKTWTSERGVVASDIAIQIHGGYGYTRDFDVEQLYRDNRLNPIHEGTTGIQGIDFVVRKLARSDGLALEQLGTRVAKVCGEAERDEELIRFAVLLRGVWDEFIRLAERVRHADQSALLSHATAILDVFGDIVVAWLWLDQTTTARTNRPGEVIAQIKLAACAYFFDVELPRTRATLASANTLSTDIAELPASTFT